MRTIFTGMLALVLLGGCATQIKTYQVKSAPTNAYTTWCWMQGCEVTYQGPQEYYNKQVLDQIATSIANQMTFRGYKQNDDSSDLLINFYLVMKQDEQQVQEPTKHDIFLNDQWLYNRHPDYVQYLKGSLVIDVIDRATSTLIWRANIIRYIDLHESPEMEEIDRVIDKAMWRFPEKGW